MRVGITGHQRLKDPSRWPWVRAEIDKLISQLPTPVTGVTSLAIGADQLFAEVVLEHGGTIEAIIPFHGYESNFAVGQARQDYCRLLGLAMRVEILEKTGSDEEAYFAAGKRLVDVIDMLVAVWDGKPAAGLGGTADVVRYALERGKRVLHLNPVSSTLTEQM